jgi:hypothetical protein
MAGGNILRVRDVAVGVQSGKSFSLGMATGRRGGSGGAEGGRTAIFSGAGEVASVGMATVVAATGSDSAGRAAGAMTFSTWTGVVAGSTAGGAMR